MFSSPTTASSAVLPLDQSVGAPDDHAGRPKRRFLGKLPLVHDPEVFHFMLDAVPTVRVSLSGRHGVGKSFITDPDAWADVSPRCGAAWGLTFNGAGQAYVSASRRQVAEVTGQPGPKPRANLARIIAGATRGQIVTHLNGNRLDLRRANLEVLSRAEAAHRRRIFFRALTRFAMTPRGASGDSLGCLGRSGGRVCRLEILKALTGL